MNIGHLASSKTRLTVVAAAVGLALAGLAGPAAAVETAGNGIYNVAIQSPTETQDGSWSAATAASHPVGTGHDILYVETGGSFINTTNFSSLQVSTAGAGPTTYAFGGRGGALDLDTYVTGQGVSAYSANGFQTTWNVTPSGVAVTQDVFVVGTTFANSAIYHTVQITNTGNGAVNIGWRNLYDWQVDDPNRDDGPSNSIETTGGVVVAATTLEFSHTPAAGEFARVRIAPGTSTYEPLLALGYDPGYVASLPVTLPDAYLYVSWPVSYGTAFAYTVDPARDVTSDSAGLSYFAASLAAGESARFTQILFGVPGGEPPPNGAPIPGPLALLGIGLVSMMTVLRRRRLAA